MRRWSIVLATVAVTASLLVATSVSSMSAHSAGTSPTLAKCRTIIKTQVRTHGKLTVGTDASALAPWFAKNTPSNGQGFESALTYLLAKELGVSAANVNWFTEPFDQSYAPGAKPFDVDVNETIYTKARAQNVTFSSRYYNVQQSLVAMKGSRIVAHHTPKQLTTYIYGAIAGSPAQAFVTAHIKPTTAVKLFATDNDAIDALRKGTINAIAVDTPTGNIYVNWEIVDSQNHPLAIQLGQFPAVGDEYYGLVLQKSNPLATCVNVAIETAKSSGAIKNLSTQWLGVYNKIPLLVP